MAKGVIDCKRDLRGPVVRRGRARFSPMCYTTYMQSHDLKTVLARIQTWPQGAQDEAVRALREIEEDFIIGPATRVEPDRSHQEALRGEGVTMEELFERYYL
jgi:hypothetical protein